MSKLSPKEGVSSEDDSYDDLIITKPIPLSEPRIKSNATDFKIGCGDPNSRIYVGILSAGVKTRLKNVALLQTN